MVVWIIIADVDFSQGVEAETKEDALKKAENFVKEINLPEEIINIEVQDVLKA